ncbi:hypothetical protein MLD38_029943 [Melastoma candidum]|uniref:Uncharacterized protein n=1 Tax=Melastoma candidum TaxID=119954 RepID=A0ACB9MM27_9MYRT|nr:hypothetical protein MLD38_029943 [Melastoma candidum]
MEGLIPFLYRAIVQYKGGEQQPAWFGDSPSAAYTRLPGDSGRFAASEHIGQIFRPEYNFSLSGPSSSSIGSSNNDNAAVTTQVIVASGVQSPVCRLMTRRVVA